MVEIRKSDASGKPGQFIVIMENCNHHCYLHADSQWYSTCVGKNGLTGYHNSMEEANDAIVRWMSNLPTYESRYHRKQPVRYVKTRK